MGSSATDEAVKNSVKTKLDSGKKKAAKPRATPPEKKKATSRKKAVTTKKVAAKKKTVKKKAPRKKAATKAVGKSVNTAETHADASPTTPATPDHTGTTAAIEGDSRSLSWMAAQAASALRAVKAHQSERAQVLIANAEITPATPVRPRKDTRSTIGAGVSETPKDTAAEQSLTPATTIQTAQAEPAGEKAQSLAASASLEIKQDTHKAPEPAKEVAKTSPAKELPAAQKEAKPASAPEPDEAVGEQAAKAAPAKVITAAAVPAAAAQPEPTVNIEQEKTPGPPAHVIANTKTSGSKRSIRPMLLTGLIILVGILGARAWLGGTDTTADIATVQDSTATKQLSPAAAKPQHDATSVVTIKPADKPADKPAANTTETDDWAPTIYTEWPEPTASQEPSQTVDTTTPSPVPNEIVVTETRQVQTTPQVSRPAAPQPGYYAPGYGYGYGNYQQQPARQQPYYQPAYARPSYSQQ